jgi:hypothetical protein
MATIQDVADQINAKLDSISASTGTTATNTGNLVTLAGDIRNQLVQSNAHLTAIDGDLQVGFANLSQGLFLLSELEKVSISLLDQNRKQNDTIICLIENSNELLCGITRKLTRQLELSAATLKSTVRIEGIEERVHAAEAADYDRLLALKAQIEACCPPPQPPLEPCPPACEKSPYHPVRPGGQDWHPLPTPKGVRPEPIG